MKKKEKNLFSITWRQVRLRKLQMQSSITMGEETPKYEMLVGVFEPDIITRLEPKQVLPYMPSIEYIALRQKLHGDSVHDDTNERRYIEIMTPQLRQIINPCEITPALLSRDVLIQEDVEEITCEANNRGSIAATDLLLKRVSGKHPKWYTELVAALFTSELKGTHSRSKSVKERNPKTEVKGMHPVSNSVKERNPTQASYKESVHEQQQFQTEIKDRYSTSLPKVPPRLPMRISKDRVESMPMKEQDEYEDTDLMNVKRETIYVYSVEDRDAIYQGHRSFQKGEIIRVIKPKDDEQDEEYYQCDDEAGNLIPKSCESASVATDTQIPESMIKTVNQMLSDLLKKHKVLEQHVEVLKEQRGVRENGIKQEDDDEEDLENITSLC
ncbi:hypothetical protein MAR_018957 [Mya arenaria]|uniref:Caspase recruitment domain-containing protein n=1 Tax=Mya arenaria TaxID=6604 RepID=A0ABY7EIM7_MYAAR|nr:hypothetical protein MAR_018957 [Mya arenaria]